MADRENVINELNECIEHIRSNEFEKIQFWGNCQMAMTDALALLKEQPHWIPAEERLPKSMINKVIVYVQHEDLASRIGFGHFEKYHGVGTWWDLERDEPFIKHGFTVTHWMPIPKSPYGEELILS